MLAAITSRDLPVIQGVVLLVAVIFVLTNLVVDVLYGVVNPKVRVA
jgi:ABC-type dipeptide/oligopeptide/nickel transport system permease component